MRRISSIILFANKNRLFSHFWVPLWLPSSLLFSMSSFPSFPSFSSPSWRAHFNNPLIALSKTSNDRPRVRPRPLTGGVRATSGRGFSFVTCKLFPSQEELRLEGRSALQIVPREIPKCLHVRSSPVRRRPCPLFGLEGYGAVLDRPPRNRARTGSEMLAIFQSRFCGKTRSAAAAGRLSVGQHTPMREERKGGKEEEARGWERGAGLRD